MFFIVWSVPREFSINHGGICALQAVLIFYFFTFSLAYGVMNKALMTLLLQFSSPREQLSSGVRKKKRIGKGKGI